MHVVPPDPPDASKTVRATIWSPAAIVTGNGADDDVMLAVAPVAESVASVVTVGAVPAAAELRW
jgi:hypothetical protein